MADIIPLYNSHLDQQAAVDIENLFDAIEAILNTPYDCLERVRYVDTHEGDTLPGNIALARAVMTLASIYRGLEAHMQAKELVRGIREYAKRMKAEE